MNFLLGILLDESKLLRGLRRLSRRNILQTINHGLSSLLHCCNGCLRLCKFSRGPDLNLVVKQFGMPQGCPHIRVGLCLNGTRKLSSRDLDVLVLLFDVVDRCRT